jgi:ATP-dependent DNA helicase RecG
LAIRLVNQRVLGVRHFARGTVSAIPPATAREAIVNAIMHRDWTRPEPIVVEHLGDQLVVTSPGPFPPGVGENNVLTTVSRPRNPHLANVLRSLRLAEREAIGVDRMYREMVLLGHRPPTIVEVADTVRCVLIGGDPVEPVAMVMSHLSEEARSDVDVALVLYRLFDHPRTDPTDLAPHLQKTPEEAADALDRAQREQLVDSIDSGDSAPPSHSSESSRSEYARLRSDSGRPTPAGGLLPPVSRRHVVRP